MLNEQSGIWITALNYTRVIVVYGWSVSRTPHLLKKLRTYGKTKELFVVFGAWAIEENPLAQYGIWMPGSQFSLNEQALYTERWLI